MKALLEKMRDMVERHADQPSSPTSIPGLVLHQLAATVDRRQAFYEPRLCIILRGAKTVQLGDASFGADPSRFLIVTADLPVISRVAIAEDGRTHLALTLDFDRALLAEVVQRLPARPVLSSQPPGLAAAPLDQGLLASFARLLSLLDSPADVAFLLPLIRQEIYYRLLTSSSGETLVQFAMSGSYLRQIAMATSWIKTHYMEPMRIEGLADLSGMSVTSFHRHFKAVTFMTPFQYRMQVRLQEARRLLLSGSLSAGKVGFTVGYDSQSQFSRDYKRLFGAPPAADARLALAQARSSPTPAVSPASIAAAGFCR